MTIVRRRPRVAISPLPLLHDMERFLRDPWIGRGSHRRPQDAHHDTKLDLDVYETEDGHVVVKADLPGVGRDDLDLSYQDGRLTIKGEVVKDEETKDEGYYRRERHHGVFTRTVALPAEIDEDGIEATFTNGVLEVRAPKAQEITAKRIEVK